jgi:autotransporter-associated beta strand protein
VDAATTLSYAGDITGSGNLTKTGDGTLNLTGSADFSGSTTIGAGGLGLSDTLPSGTDLAVNGTLNLLSSFTVNTLSGSGTVNMSTYNLTVSNSSSSDDATFSGVIDSSTGRFIKSGDGSQTLSGTNTYSGTTINGGTLKVSSDANLGTSPGSTDVDNIILGGGTLNTTATFTLGTNRGITLTGNSTINVDSSTTLTYGGVITDNGSTFNITKSGSGAIILSGTHTYDGDTTISAGSLTLSGAFNSATDVVVSSGVTWDLQVNQTINSLNLDGTISNSAGASALTVTTTSDIGGNITTAGTQTYTGAVTVSSDVTLTTTDSNVLFSATIEGSGSAESLTITAGTGSVTFANTIGATTALNMLTVNATGGIYVAGNISTEDSLSDGLYYILINSNTYFNDNLTYFNTNTPGSSGLWPYSTINVQDNSQIIYGDSETFNYRWSGYFTPDQTGTWNFRTNSDDSSLVYIGSAGTSISSYISTLQASSSISGKSTLVVNNSGLHGDRTASGSISLTAGNAYPFVSYFAENGGGATMVFSYGFGNYNSTNVSAAGGLFTNDQSSGSSSSGTITFNGNVTLTGSSTMTGNTQFAGTLTGGSNALTVTGNLDLDGTASGLTSTSVSGTSTLAANVTTSTTQTYTGAVTLSADTSLTSTNSAISFGSTIDSDSTNRDLSLATGSGDISVTGAIGGSNTLDVLTVNNTGTLTLSSDVTATTMTLTHTGGTTIGGTLTATTVNLTDTTDAASITFNGNVTATTLNTAAKLTTSSLTARPQRSPMPQPSVTVVM